MFAVEEELRRRIQAKGPLSFVEFAEVALYWPDGGYYPSTAQPAGPLGDFYTSPTAHPAFGACLGLQLRQMWLALGRPHPFYVVEPGAGDGLLCRDIVGYMHHVGMEVLGSLCYLLLDRSAGPGLEGELAPALRRGVCRLRAAGIPLAPLTGCILSNELLDAFPVHRVTVEGGRLREVFVALDAEGRFVEVIGDPSVPELEERFRELGIRLPDGYRTEVNLGLRPWTAEVARALERGFVLVVDYGHPAEALYGAERSRGTLRCYYRHTLSADPYRRVGRQDISVHVDFTTLEREAVRAGLLPLGLATQREFLMNLGLGAFLRALDRGALQPQERRRNRAGMMELAQEDGLGSFRVLALGKGVGSPRLHGFHAENPLRRWMEADPGHIAPPLATPHHMPFGRAPGEPQELPTWEELTR